MKSVINIKKLFFYLSIAFLFFISQVSSLKKNLKEKTKSDSERKKSKSSAKIKISTDLKETSSAEVTNKIHEIKPPEKEVEDKSIEFALKKTDHANKVLTDYYSHLIKQMEKNIQKKVDFEISDNIL